MSYGKIVAQASQRTPQTQPLFGRTDQVQNNAGGFVFEVSNEARLNRFLILGSLGGTYYVGEEKLTDEVTRFLISMANDVRTVEQIVRVATSQPARAPKPDHAIYALAVMVAKGTPAVKAAALNELRFVCRIPTHLFIFMESYKALGGKMGRSVQRALQNWYQFKNLNQLSYHALKYQSRNGWSNRDVLRLARPTPTNEGHKNVYRWIVTGETPDASNEYLFDGHRLLRDETVSSQEAVRLIASHSFTHEMVPTHFQKDRNVMQALFETMPIGASLRKLGQLTSLGLLDVNSANETVLIDRLAPKNLIAGRIHPIDLFLTKKIYDAGRGDKGSLTWVPNYRISTALEDAFYNAFGTLQPTGKRFLIGLDVSGSMSSMVGAKTPMTCREAAALMSMIQLRVEDKVQVMAFTNQFVRLNINKNTRIQDATKEAFRSNFGSTDCALPMIYALEKKIPVDVFMVYTDNETFVGNIHPIQALKKYREATGIDAKLIVHAFTPTKFTIADPKDPGMLDVCGLDTSTPQLVREFIQGF